MEKWHLVIFLTKILVVFTKRLLLIKHLHISRCVKESLNRAKKVHNLKQIAFSHFFIKDKMPFNVFFDTLLYLEGELGNGLYLCLTLFL